MWIAVAGCVLVVAVAWVVLTRMRPAYDAFGWLGWGRQVLRWNLNTDGAPSWKPLTFLFTLPYALAGANPQMWLWMITSTAAALGGAVFGARIAYRLTGPCPERPWAPLAAGAFAGVGVLGLGGYSQLVLNANSDPMVVTLCLAAIDCHLSGRFRLAFASLVLVSLGRPEGWAFAGLYAIWAWRADPSMRILAVAGVVLIPVAWFVVPGITSHSWFISGDLALNSANVIHGNKIVGVIDRLRSLYELPMQLAVLCALVLAAVRRDRLSLTLAGSAFLWAAIEIAFAYHGWSAVPRYLIEPGAVLVVVAGGAVGSVLAYEPSDRWRPRTLRWILVVPVLALVVALIPAARSRARLAHAEIHSGHNTALELSRLEAVIRQDGGATRIRRCGQPVTLLGYQSELAWAIGLNVGNVGFRPGKSIAEGLPIVLFNPHDDGWQVRPIDMLAADAVRCDALNTDSQLGPDASAAALHMQEGVT
jgi:hypothetical protein